MDWLLIRMLKNNRLELIALDFIRHNLSNRLISNLGSSVRFGIFEGLELDESSAWDQVGSTATKILGIYEHEILTELKELGDFETLINVGAADGYYAFGLLHANKCRKAIIFESDLRSRQQILGRNSVVKADIQVLAEANQISFVSAIDDVDLSRAIVIADIEGAEFSLFEDEIIERLSKSTIILEVHEFLNPEYSKEELELKFKKHFIIKTLQNKSRTLPNLEFLDGLHDNLKWLLVSEGRIQTMEWWILKPKSEVG